mgnify:CR=1 FL=1|nr:MAG TPA: homing endonuclease [Caudoviricetes sp.]
MAEYWKWIEGYEGLYQVSNLGRIKSYYRSTRILKKLLSTDGYEVVGLWKNKKPKRCSVHRLVAQAFIANSENLPEVNHIDEDKTNNFVENLEWCTHEYNMKFGTGMTRNINSNKTKNGKPIFAINKDGTDFFFASVRELCKNLNLDKGAVFACLRGDQLTHKGFSFELQDFNERG